MTRVKRGITSHKRREKNLKYAKGFKWGRKSKERSANEALFHAWSYAFTSRKLLKRDKRKEWQGIIGAGARGERMNYSKLMGALKKKNIMLDRKILADLAEHYPEIFKEVARHAQA